MRERKGGGKRTADALPVRKQQQKAPPLGKGGNERRRFICIDSKDLSRLSAGWLGTEGEKDEEEEEKEAEY